MLRMSKEAMTNEPDYEDLYHLMNQWRGLEYRKLKHVQRMFNELVELFEETDRVVEDRFIEDA